ncbi:MAG TPA: hypothetical protein VF720_10295 [Candidatus Eisenbacteria bacterium]
MSTRAGSRRSLASRLADAIVLLFGVASVLTVAEVAVRPFYPAAPDVLHRQVTHRASQRFGWELVPDPGSVSFTAPAPIDVGGHRDQTIQHSMAMEFNPPPGAAARWLVAGGGNSFGVAVEAGDAFPYLAAGGGTEPPAALVNTGVEGYDLGQKTRRIEAEAPAVLPTVILLEIDAADLPAGGTRDSTDLASRFAVLEHRINRAPPPDRDWYGRLLGRSRLASLLDGRARAFLQLGRRLPAAAPSPGRREVRAIDLLLGRETPVIDTAWQTLGAELDRIARTADRVRARVCVVAMPMPAQLRRPYPRATFQSRLERLCRERGFVFVDPLPVLREKRRTGTRTYLPRLPYLNEVGHGAVAEAIRRELETTLAREDHWRLPSRLEE